VIKSHKTCIRLDIEALLKVKEIGSRSWEAPVATNKFLEGFNRLNVDVVGFRSVLLPLIQEVLARRHNQGSQKFDGDPHGHDVL
jgi:hypothetical protein